MTITAQIIEKINSTLNVPGQPHLCPRVGDWIDRGCIEWSPIYREREAVSKISSELAYMILRAAEMNRNNGFTEADFERVRKILESEPVLAYRTGPFWNTIIVAPITNQFDILRFEETIGNNIGLDTETLIEGLKYLDRRYGIDITGAGCDAVEFTLKRIPADEEACELGIWLEILCPDLLETPTSFPKGKVELWWD